MTKMAAHQWRCFFCGETFSRPEDAAEHFGAPHGDDAACRIKAHEGHIVHALRKAQKELARYRAEDSDLMRSILTLEGNNAVAVRRAEEEGYARGVADTLALSCPDCVAKMRGPVPDGTDWSQTVPALAMQDGKSDA